MKFFESDCVVKVDFMLVRTRSEFGARSGYGLLFS